MNSDRSQTSVVVAAAGTLSALGILTATIGGLIVAGMFGISAALASQIVNAVAVGGWVLAAVFAALTGGIAGISIALVRGLIAKYGKTVAAT